MMRKKLLLVEDSVTIRKVFELAFEKSDISVVAVDTGDEVVRMAAELAPDLVVVDVTLPEKDGFEVASAILENERTKDLPVLILSGTLLPLDEEKFRACGAKGVLFKPFETMELLDKVESLIGKREEALPVVESPEPLPVVGSPVSAPVVEAPAPPPPVDEHWDFSDVLDEVEETTPAAKSDAAARRMPRRRRPRRSFPRSSPGPPGRTRRATTNSTCRSTISRNRPRPRPLRKRPPRLSWPRLRLRPRWKRWRRSTR